MRDVNNVMCDVCPGNLIPSPEHQDYPQVARAIDSLHLAELLWLDAKPENVLVDQGESPSGYVVKVSQGWKCQNVEGKPILKRPSNGEFIACKCIPVVA